MPAPLRDRVVLLGQVSEEDKVRVYHSVDVFCAPNTGGESFGIVLAEAMAAGAPIVASDLDAFRRVLRGGRAGELFDHRRPGGLAAAVGRLLDDPQRRARAVGRRERGGAGLRLAEGGQGRGAGVRGRRCRRRTGKVACGAMSPLTVTSSSSPPRS